MTPKRNIEKIFKPEFNDPAGWWGASIDMYWSVYYYPEELETVVKFFNSMPENNILEIASKLIVAHDLVLLKYKPVTTFLIKIACIPCEKIEEEKDWQEDVWTNLENKLFAAINLIELEDVRGKNILLKIEKMLSIEFLKFKLTNKAGDTYLEYIVNYLADSKNKMGVDLCFYFSKKYDWIKTPYDHIYFQRKFQKNSNKVLNEYEYRRNGGFLYNARMYALEDKQEFKNLVELFHAMPENSKESFQEKIDVADVLVDLDYKPVADFLVKVATAKKDSTLGEYIYHIDKESAVVNLIKLEDKQGPKLFEKHIAPLDNFGQRLAVDDLLKLETETSINLLIELSKKYDGVKEYYNKDFVQEKIREILKNLDSKGKI